ncbi:MAG: CooT family nickel-binding protein [Nitrospirota bacterium]|jgi:predicted RNA-binding protein
MCELNAYVLRDGTQELVLESVTVIQAEQGTVVVRNLFGEEKRLQAKIKEVSLKNNTVVLEA